MKWAMPTARSGATNDRLRSGSIRADQIAQKREEAERAFHRVGITLSMARPPARERLIPFDIVPRITDHPAEI
ncbi:MAG TPA: hypothetical protein VF814_03545 [Casimicrobiaceae bacterium]